MTPIDLLLFMLAFAGGLVAIAAALILGWLAFLIARGWAISEPEPRKGTR